VDQHRCTGSGCAQIAETDLEGHLLCGRHFYAVASKRLAVYRSGHTGLDGTARSETAISALLSDLVSKATGLAAKSASLTTSEREEMYELALSALALRECFPKGLHLEPHDRKQHE